jgi:branched-chain amino acid transport system permease protein
VKRAGGRLALVALVAAAVLAYPWVFPGPFPQHLMILVMLFGLLGTAWNLLGGFTGQVSLGHAVFFGAGAYTSTLLLQHLGWSPWLGMPAGALAATLLALAIGYPCFRLSGHYFAIATIAIGEIVFILVTNWEFAGGAVGLFLPIADEGLASFQFHASKTPYYYLAAALLALGLALAAWLRRVRPGYYWRAIREDQAAARSLGVPALRYKQLAMALSAALTACAGTFYAQYVLFIDPGSVLPLSLSIQICLVAVLGGVGTISGPLVGAAVLVAISEFTRVKLGAGGRSLDLIAYGLLIMLIARFEPGGLVGLARRVARRRAGAALGCALALALSPASALATEAAGGAVVRRGALPDDLYVAGRDVEVDAEVRGDVLAAGGRVRIGRSVTGDVMAAGGEVVVLGRVADDARLAGGTVAVDAVVAGDLIAAGGRVRVGPDAAIGGRARLGGGEVLVAGRLARGLKVAAGTLRIAGAVDGDVDVVADSVEVLPAARISGDLTYRSPAPARIDPSARVAGSVTHHEADWRDRARQARRAAGLAGRLAFWLGLAAAGALFLLLFPRFAVAAARTVASDPGKSLGLGFALLVATPVAALLLLITVVGVPLGLALFALYPVALLAGLLVAVLFLGDSGARLARRPRLATGWRFVTYLLALLGLALVMLVPAVGAVTLALALVTGLGALVLAAYRVYAGRPAALSP